MPYLAHSRENQLSHIGLITPPYTGHVNPMITLGRELKYRGHRVSVISTLDAQKPVLANDLEFIPVGTRQFPLGSLEKFTETQGRLTGMRAIRFIIKDLTALAAMHKEDLTDAVVGNGVDALVIDQIQTVGQAVSEKHDIPFVSLCSLLPLNTDLGVPPWTMYWPYEDSTQARVRNKIAYQVRYMIESSYTREAHRARAKFGLPVKMSVDESFSKLAQIAQVPEFFDFPRNEAPECFHNTGPLTDLNRSEPVPFPWESLDGRPLVYASMGTLQNRMMRVFRTMAEACADMDVQLVISLGSPNTAIPTDFPGNPIIVNYAPQLDLLKRASLYIGHGGMNSTLQALACGVPMVLLPVTNDNPGVAARAKYHGVAEFIPVGRVNTRKLRAAIETVRTKQSYRDSALKFQDLIKGMDAVSRSADIVEEAFRTGRPVLREAA